MSYVKKPAVAGGGTRKGSKSGKESFTLLAFRAIHSNLRPHQESKEQQHLYH